MSYPHAKPQGSKSLESHLIVLAKISAEVYGIPFNNVCPKQLAGLASDESFRNVPTSEPEKSAYLDDRGKELFAKIFECLLEAGHSSQKVIKGECLQVFFRLLQFSNYRSFRLHMSPSADRWRLIVTAFVFDCLGLLMELSPASAARFISEPVHLGIKLLDMSGNLSDKDVTPEATALILKCYRFLSSALNEPVVADVFAPADVRELAVNIVKDVAKSASTSVQSAAVSCSTILFQSQGAALKGDIKNRLFAALVCLVRLKVRSNRERRLLSGEVQLCWRIYGALTAFILSSAVHIGVLNVCTAVFEDGMKIKDFDVQIICKQGLQIISSLVRPRVPKDVVENPGMLMEAATGANESVDEIAAQPVRTRAAVYQRESKSVSAVENTLPHPSSVMFVDDAGSAKFGSEQYEMVSDAGSDLVVNSKTEIPGEVAGMVKHTDQLSAAEDGPDVAPAEPVSESVKELPADAGNDIVDKSAADFESAFNINVDEEARELMTLFHDSDTEVV